MESGYFDFVEGHANAAGFSIPAENGEHFLEYCQEKLAGVNFNENTYEVDYVFTHGELSEVEAIANLVDRNKEIWGNNVTEPRIALKDIFFTGKDIFRMGANKDSVKLTIDGLEIVKFKDAEFAEELSEMDSIRMTAVGRLGINEWGGKRTAQFIIEDYEIANSKYDF